MLILKQKQGRIRIGLFQRCRAKQPCQGFTIIELLVVIVIISILLGLLMVALGSARSTAYRTQCLNNLREIGMATQVYVNAKDKYPPAWVSGPKRWMDFLKPYLDKKCYVYQCPSDPAKKPYSYDPEITLSYGINLWRKTGYTNNSHYFWYTVNSYDIRYPSRVILFADCTPGKMQVGNDVKEFGNPVQYVDYRHANGTFNAVYCDGHAETKIDTVQSDWDAMQ